jgi:hypothetical protein
VPGLRLCGEAFANLLMVFEFLHNFGETLGFGKGILLLKGQRLILVNNIRDLQYREQKKTILKFF